MKEEEAQAIVATARERGPFDSIFCLWRASGVSATTLLALARADAFGSLGLDRQHAVWAVQALDGQPLPLFERPFREIQRGASSLPVVEESHEVVRDYRTVGLSLKSHPLSFLRERLNKMSVRTAAELKNDKRSPHGRFLRVAGLVLFRQRPATARGVLFMTLEDETGRSDLIIRPTIYERFRTPALASNIIIARGKVERASGVTHLLVTSLRDATRLGAELPDLSRNFR